jgi:hypothetical protein
MIGRPEPALYLLLVSFNKMTDGFAHARRSKFVGLARDQSMQNAALYRTLLGKSDTARAGLVLLMATPIRVASSIAARQMPRLKGRDPEAFRKIEPIAPAPTFAIRRPAVAVLTLDDC